MDVPMSPLIVSGGDDSTPTTPLPHKQKSCTLSRVATLTELQSQYSVDIARLSTLNKTFDADISSEFTNITSQLSVDTQRSGIQNKLEKTWTLMLSHISRMDTQSATNEAEFEYLQNHQRIPNKPDHASSSSSSKRVHRRRTSFFNEVGLATDSRRSVLEAQPLHTRLMNINSVRWLYHFGSRASSLADQITDLILLMSLVLAGATTHYLKYLCFLLMPYIVLSLLLLAPLSRRSQKLSALLFSIDGNNNDSDEDTQLTGRKRKLRLVPALMTPVLLPLYLAIMVPYLLSLDFYIYFRLMGKDLATTRYFLYYWRLKTIIEILFEAMPQTVFLLTTDLSNVNPLLVIFSLCSSIGLFSWSIFKIYAGGKKTGFGTWLYFKRYYVEQGIEMIPYLEAIVQNNLIELSLRDAMRVSEWKHMAKSLFFNFSVQQLSIHGQHHIPPKVWSLLFYSMENNRLSTIDLTDCHLMGMNPICPEKAKEMTDLDSIDLASVVTTTFNKKSDNFNPFQKVNHDDTDSNAADMNQGVRFTRLIVLYSLQRVIHVSALQLQCIQLKENNLSSLTPLLLNAISQCCNLQTLDLSSNYISMTDEDALMHSFSDLLKECQQITTLILDDNGLSDSFAKILISILSDSDFEQRAERNTTEKGTENTKYSVETMELAHDTSLHMMDSNNKSSLKLLSLENNELTMFGAKTLFKVCNTCKITINLERNNIDTQQWMRLMGTMLIDVNQDDFI